MNPNPTPAPTTAPAPAPRPASSIIVTRTVKPASWWKVLLTTMATAAAVVGYQAITTTPDAVLSNPVDVLRNAGLAAAAVGLAHLLKSPVMHEPTVTQISGNGEQWRIAVPPPDATAQAQAPTPGPGPGVTG